MSDQRFLSIERVTGSLLVLGFAANLTGVLMFFVRGGVQGGAPPSPATFIWERSFLLAAVVLTVIGLVLLEVYLHNTAGRALARVGATVYLFGGILVVAAEALDLNPGHKNTSALIAIYVVLALLAQAIMGGALLQAGLLSAWIGWATIIWNIAWLVVLPVTSPRDMYYPMLHHLMPLMIGIALLWRAPQPRTEAA